LFFSTIIQVCTRDLVVFYFCLVMASTKSRQKHPATSDLGPEMQTKWQRHTRTSTKSNCVATAQTQTQMQMQTKSKSLQNGKQTASKPTPHVRSLSRVKNV